MLGSRERHSELGEGADTEIWVAAGEGETIVEKICRSTTSAWEGPTHAGLKPTAQTVRVIFTSAKAVGQER